MTAALRTRSRWRTALVVLGIVALLVAAAYVALVRAFPPERLAALLAARVKAETGRDFRIGGDVSFRLWPTLAVVANDVAFGNAEWGSRPDMVTLRRAAFAVALRPLLSGEVHVLAVDIDGADVLLESDRSGRSNWILEARAATQPPAAASAPAAAPGPLQLDGIALSDTHVTYRDGRSGTSRTIAIESLRLTKEGDRVLVSAVLGGEHRSWRLEGKTGAYEALVDGKDDWPFDLQLVADGAKLVATGTVGSERSTRALRADVVAHLENTAVLAPLLADAARLPVPFDGAATVTRAGDLVKVDGLRLSVPGLSLGGRVSVRTDGPQPQVDADLAAQSIDLSKWAGKKGEASVPSGAGKSPRIFSSTPLPALALPGFTVRADLRVDRLVLAGLPPLSTVTAQVRSEPGRLVLDPIAFGVANGQARGRVELATRASEPLRMKVQVDAQNLSMEALDSATGPGGHVRGGRASLRANLGLTGTSVQGLAASTSGSALVSINDVALLGGAAALDRNVVVVLLDALLPKQQAGKPLKISCAVVNLPFRAGAATIDRSIAMETEQVAVAASGGLDLAAETVKLSFKPSVKSGIGLNPASLARLVMVEGPLREPHVGVDMGGAVAEAANIGAAVATGGLTLLGKRVLAQPEDTQVCRHAAVVSRGPDASASTAPATGAKPSSGRAARR
jgi:uncharacterized protein involved in outer membrane biogenesis